MSPTSFSQVIDSIKPFSNYVYLHIKGEPLLHSKFGEIINICADKGINVNITTNGSLLEKRKKELSNNKIRQINISLQSYEKDVDLDEINSIIDTTNYLLDINKNLNIVYRFWAIKNNNYSKTNKIIINYLMNKYDLSPTFLSELNSKKNIKIADRLYINEESIFNWPNLDNNFTSFYGKCLGTCNQIGILSDGTVVPCCLDSNGIINFGNIFEKNLSDILKSDRFVNMNKKIHENQFIEQLCQHCEFKNRFNFNSNK